MRNRSHSSNTSGYFEVKYTDIDYVIARIGMNKKKMCCRLRTRRALTLFNTIPLRTRRALWHHRLCTVKAPFWAPFHRSCHQCEVQWLAWFWLAINHCCHGSCHWMISCHAMDVNCYKIGPRFSMEHHWTTSLPSGAQLMKQNLNQNIISDDILVTVLLMSFLSNASKRVRYCICACVS